MCGGDKTPEGFNKLEIREQRGETQDTLAKRQHLWDEAQRFAATNPFQQQYDEIS